MSLDLPEKAKFLLLRVKGEENLVSFSDIRELGDLSFIFFKNYFIFYFAFFP